MDEKNNSGFVSLVGAGPGDPGLITRRGMARMAQADVVVYDRLANPLLLRLAPMAELIPVGKQPGHHPIPQEEINKILVEKARLGKRVVRLKGGDPFVFGRGGEEALVLKEAGIQFEVVPGVTSAIAAPAYAGIPVTHRKVAGSVAFITGHRAERMDEPGLTWPLNGLTADTLVFMMGVKNLSRITAQLLAEGRSPETPAALVEQGTSAAQKIITGTLSNIETKTADIQPPAVFIVGDVVGLQDQLSWFDMLEQRPLHGLRVLNTKSRPPRDRNGSASNNLTVDNFSDQIFSMGADVIEMPVLRAVSLANSRELQEMLQQLITGKVYSWVVFTSANGVRFFFEKLYALRADARSLKGVKIAAIGPATAGALQSCGVLPDFIPTSFTGADLGSQLPIMPGQKILLPRSEIALPDLPEILKARGCNVDQLATYTVKTVPPDDIVLEHLVAGEIDVVTFFSPSGLNGFAEMLSSAGYSAPIAEILAPLTVACIGPTTKNSALEMGIQVEIVAREHTSSGLVEELVRWRKRS